MLDFDAEFQQMLQESTSQAKKGIEHMPQKRHEIVIPVSQIKRKLPEIGKIDNVVEPTTPADPSQPVPPGGIKIAGSKMAFALITKNRQGRKINVQKIALDSQSQLVLRTQQRMEEDERERQIEKKQLKDIQAMLAAA